MVKRSLISAFVSTSALLGVAQPVLAQGGDGAQNSLPSVLDEMIITAERRESTLQTTPIAISAFGEEFLRNSSVRDVQDLAQYAPGLTFNRVSNFTQLNIRGIGLEQINLGGEPGVALHVDGVYLARPFVGDAIFSDLQRVEVLRGPQGTLYGRNATGGSVNLVPNQPTSELEGQLGFTYGNYNRIRGQGVVSGPLGEGVRGRLSFVSDQNDGYLDDLLDGDELDDRRARSVRGQLSFDIANDFTLDISADYNHEGGTGPVFQPGRINGAFAGTAIAFGGRTDPDPRRLYDDGPHDQDIDSWGVSARMQWDIGSVAVTSLTAYRDSEFRLISDLDGTDFFLINEDLAETGKQFSQEVQFASTNDSPFQWLFGLYYFSEDGTLDYSFPVPILSTTIAFDAEQETRAYAAFGELRYSITDALTATVGLRWSSEKKKGSTVQDLFGQRSVNVEDKWEALTPRFVLDYQITDEALVYASASRGFKAGGLNTASIQANAYDPEYIWNYEFGLKNRFFDDRLQTNLAAFYYKYDDLQVNQFAVGQTFIENAASAKGKGVELEVMALPVPNLMINASVANLDAEFDEFMSTDSFRPALGVLDLGGNELPRAPNLTASFAAQYDVLCENGSTVRLRGEYAHRASHFFTPFNTDFAEGGEYDLFNTRVAYISPNEAWEAAVFGKNLGDEDYEQTVTVSGINAGTLVLFGPPRTYGVELRYRF